MISICGAKHLSIEEAQWKYGINDEVCVLVRYALGRCRGRAVEREAPMGGSVQVRRREGREGEKGELRPKETRRGKA